MELHNLVEDEVIQIINEICDEQERSPTPAYETSPACRVDAACFVLNRVPPRYVSSARGFAHTMRDLAGNSQSRVDLVALAHEGLRRVSRNRRFYYGDPASLSSTSVGGPPAELSGPTFVFPVITGRILSGVTFEAADDLEVELRYQDKPIAMRDARWQNPFPISAWVGGTYSFLPYPFPADYDGQHGRFELALAVDDPRFESLRYYFSLHLVARNYEAHEFRLEEYSLPDLFVLPREAKQDT